MGPVQQWFWGGADFFRDLPLTSHLQVYPGIRLPLESSSVPSPPQTDLRVLCPVSLEPAYRDPRSPRSWGVCERGWRPSHWVRAGGGHSPAQRMQWRLAAFPATPALPRSHLPDGRQEGLLSWTAGRR